METTHLDIVRKFFDDDGWTYKLNDDQTIVTSSIKMANGTYLCLVQVIPSINIVAAYLTCTEEVPVGLRPKIAEFITRANYGLAKATIEMDFEDGSLRCRSGLLADTTQLTSALVANLVYSAAYSMDRYYPGLMAVLYSSRSIKDILADVEG